VEVVPDRAEWIAFVMEELGEDEAGPIATARFSVHLERQSGTGDDFEIADEAMSLDDALAWASERAARVLVRRGGFGDHAYTAGEVPIEETPPLSDALPVEPRRLPGWEFVDRTTADPPISWDVVVEGYQPAQAIGEKYQPFDSAVGERWVASLHNAPIQVVEVRTDWAIEQPSGRTWVRLAQFPVAVVRVQARTVEDARSVTDHLLAETTDVVGAAAAWGVRASAAYATGSAPARANARVEVAGPKRSADS
jgi:hypothetical protein